MAIDYVVNLNCVPKETLGTEGIIERIKGRARAEAIIRLYRERGDGRPPSQMGFELTRSTPDGGEESRVIVVQSLLDDALELDPLAPYCVGCPANALDQPFGCIGQIQYPITTAAELWLLKQLPGPDEPLPWLLLRQTVEEMGYTGVSVEPLRASGVYLQDGAGFARNLGEFQVTANQLFEMLFMLGHIQPAHAGVLLLFVHAIPRGGEANQISEVLSRALPPDELRATYPFLLDPAEADDQTIIELKQFFRALWHAWSLNVLVLLDV